MVISTIQANKVGPVFIDCDSYAEWAFDDSRILWRQGKWVWVGIERAHDRLTPAPWFYLLVYNKIGIANNWWMCSFLYIGCVPYGKSMNGLLLLLDVQLKKICTDMYSCIIKSHNIFIYSCNFYIKVENFNFFLMQL